MVNVIIEKKISEEQHRQLGSGNVSSVDISRRATRSLARAVKLPAVLRMLRLPCQRELQALVVDFEVMLSK